MKNKSSNPLDKLRLKVGGVPEHFNLPWRLAIEEGLFREQNIMLHWSDMSGGTGQMIKGLETGSIDVAVVLTEGITKAILQGLDASILRVYVSSPLCWGIHVPFHSNIKNIQDLESKQFAISREASGSHLMAYVLGAQNGWDLKEMRFQVVGDIYGGLWALENNEAQAFLWEKYTTNPYVEQKKCRRINEIVTPWSSFVIAARNDVIKDALPALNKICDLVSTRAEALKNSKRSAEIISWRYNIDLYQVKQWLRQTEWNNSEAKGLEAQHREVVAYLLNLELISENEAKDWKEKLFT
jgi:sulfonate transport system substrate-binding protein